MSVGVSVCVSERMNEWMDGGDGQNGGGKAQAKEEEEGRKGKSKSSTSSLSLSRMRSRQDRYVRQCTNIPCLISCVGARDE